MPECKYCNVELEFDDTIDEDWDDDTVIAKEVGHCPKCNKNYFWFDYFEYKRSSQPKEIKLTVVKGVELDEITN